MAWPVGVAALVGAIIFVWSWSLLEKSATCPSWIGSVPARSCQRCGVLKFAWDGLTWNQTQQHPSRVAQLRPHQLSALQLAAQLSS